MSSLYITISILLLTIYQINGQKPNFIYILQDDLGFHDIGFNNADAAHNTQNITTLAKEGIVLNRHYVHWHCSPSRRSLLTGRLPLHHGEFLSTADSDEIDLRWNWVSDKLAAQGYDSYWYGKGHTGYKNSYLFLGGSGSYTKLPRWNNSIPDLDETYSTDKFGKLAANALEKHDSKRPFFLYLPFQAVHTPYDLPPECQSPTTPPPNICNDAIQVMLQDADYWVGKLVDTLKKRGLYENTLIVYSADNGGVTNGINYPLRGEKHTNWEGGMRVASFVSGGFIPDSLRGSSNNHTLHIVDWYATFAKLAGADPRDDPPVDPLPVDPKNPNKDIYGKKSFPPVDGRDIWDLIIHPEDHPHLSEAHPSLALSREVLIKGKYKLVVAQPDPSIMSAKSVNNGWKTPNGTWIQPKSTCGTNYFNRTNFQPCLFDLEDDPREMKDLSTAMPDLVEELWKELNTTWLTSFVSRTPEDISNNAEDPNAILVSTFYPFGTDEVVVVPNASTLLNPSFEAKPFTVENVTAWPNLVHWVDNDATVLQDGSEGTVLVAGGFFVSPKKSTGSVDLFDVSNFPSVKHKKVSTDKKANFYHQAVFYDVNGDGRDDVVAARAFKSMNPFSKPDSELIWIQQPETPNGEWETHVILSNGPDVDLFLQDIDGDGKPEVVATEFFVNQRLAIYSCSEKFWSLCGQSNITVEVVDDSSGPFFSAEWVDLNGDGQGEILATTNRNDGKGSVLAYNFKTDAEGKRVWTKNVLATSFMPTKRYLPGRGAPGRATAFFPTVAAEIAKRPYILVSGDDAGYVDLLTPSITGDFIYNRSRVVQSTGTVGTPAIHDLDKDGNVELVIPLFAENKVAVFAQSESIDSKL
eukprot:g3988.t1